MSMRGSWCSKDVMRTYGVGVWKHIRRGWDKFSNFVRFEVGVGSKVNFCHDHWREDKSLNLSYLALFSIAWCKDVWVADNKHFQDGIISWNVIFTRPV
jgi:hypothetical protein